MTEKDEFGLNAYFEAGRKTAELPTAALLGRIMADAEAQQVGPDPSVSPAPRAGFFASLRDAVGGWPTLAGLATAGVAGVWIGFSQPVGLDLVAEQIWGAEDATYLVDLLPAFGDDLEEG